MKKIFIVGINLEESLLSYYALTLEDQNGIGISPLLPLQKFKNNILKQNYFKQKNTLKKDKPTGYFIIQHLQSFIGYNQENWKSYLSHSSLLAPILSQEIKNNKIVILKPNLYNSHWLIPYKTTENSLFPEGFHNIGQSYYWEEPIWLKECSQTQTFKNKNSLFYCKVLPGYLQKAGLNISFSDNIHKSPFLDIQFLGPLLGVIHSHSSLDGAASWSNIQIYLDCNKNSGYQTLFDIGNSQWHVHKKVKVQAKVILAPLKLRVPLKNCKKDDIKKIKLTFTEKHSRRGIKKEHIVWDIN